MSGDSSRQKKAFLAFADRFEDVLTDNVHGVAAFGIVLAWVWMGLVKGQPAFMNGEIDTASVVIVMLALAATLLLLGSLRARPLLADPRLWVASSLISGAVCVGVLLLFYGFIPADAAVALAVVRLSMIVIGISLGILILGCATVFSTLRPASSAVSFFIACVVMVAACLTIMACKNVAGRVVEGLVFCLLPPAAGLLLYRSRVSLEKRLSHLPDDEGSFGKGFISMCASFAVFFFAAGAKAALEPSHEFHTASEVSFAGILVFAFLLFYLVGIKERPFGIFKLIKVVYPLAVLTLVLCIVLAPLSIDPYMSIIFDADCMVLVMVLWLLVAYVSFTNENYVGRVVGLAFGPAAGGMALGWVAGAFSFWLLGHSRTMVSVGLACAVALFSLVGFSSVHFPYLTVSGKGARKMQRNKERESATEVDYRRLFADEVGLSAREYEVLLLLLEGHNATSVAQRLVVSYHTARSHVHNIYVKARVHSRAELLEEVRRFPEKYGAPRNP